GSVPAIKVPFALRTPSVVHPVGELGQKRSVSIRRFALAGADFRPSVARVGVDEAVAEAGLCEKVAWPGRVGLGLAAQLRDVHVQVVRLFVVWCAPDLPDDGRLGEELAFVLREQAQ